MRQRDDAPVVARLAAAAGFPAVAHVDAAARHQQAGSQPEVLVVDLDHVGAVLHRGQVEQRGAVRALPVDLRLAIHAQARDAAVRVDVHAQVGVGVGAEHVQIVVAVALQGGGRNDLGPLRGVGRLAVRQVGGVDGRGRREVAGEVAGIDVHALDHARPGQLDDAVVIAAVAAAARFPAVHPLAVVVVLAGNEDGRLGVEHAVLGREEFIGRERGHGAQAGVRQVRIAAREVGGVRIERRHRHGRHSLVWVSWML